MTPTVHWNAWKIVHPYSLHCYDVTSQKETEFKSPTRFQTIT